MRATRCIGTTQFTSLTLKDGVAGPRLCLPGDIDNSYWKLPPFIAKSLFVSRNSHTIISTPMYKFVSQCTFDAEVVLEACFALPSFWLWSLHELVFYCNRPICHLKEVLKVLQQKAQILWCVGKYNFIKFVDVFVKPLCSVCFEIIKETWNTMTLHCTVCISGATFLWYAP